MLWNRHRHTQDDLPTKKQTGVSSSTVEQEVTTERASSSTSQVPDYVQDDLPLELNLMRLNTNEIPIRDRYADDYGNDAVRNPVVEWLAMSQKKKTAYPACRRMLDQPTPGLKVARRISSRWDRVKKERARSRQVRLVPPSLC